MNKNSKTYKAIIPYVERILDGYILSVDPSTGSASSMPGYAIFKKGKLTESGIIEVDSRMARQKKLYEISRTFREEFEKPDLLIVEYIPNVSYSGGMNNVAVMALQKAIGAIIASFDTEMLEIPASAWRHYKPPEYKKTDEFDGITMGLCAIAIAKQIKKQED